MVDNLPHITPISILSIVENHHVLLKRKILSYNNTYLWHLCLGHINLNRIQRLVKYGTLHSLVLDDLPICESCIKLKWPRDLLMSKGLELKNIWSLCILMCGPFNVKACKGYEYFITFTNDYTRHGSLCLMHKKSNALDKFKEFKVESGNQLGKRLKALWYDWGGEYMSSEFVSFLKEHGIISHLSAPRTPKWNRVVKRRNWMLLDMVRSMMSFSILFIAF